MTNETESILDKVSKLLAKAKGTTNENEAAIFAAKAAELLAKHNLDEAMLRERDASREEGPIGDHNYAGRVPDRWRELILMGCAKLYFCTVTVSSSTGKRKYTVHGREHNARVAILMAEYLIATVKRMAREYSDVKAEQGDFRRGAGARLHERLVELHRANTEPPEVPSASTGTTLPALYAGEARALSEYLAQRFPKMRSVNRKGMKMGLGAMAGKAAANTINLNTQVSGGRPAATLR